MDGGDQEKQQGQNQNKNGSKSYENNKGQKKNYNNRPSNKNVGDNKLPKNNQKNVENSGISNEPTQTGGEQQIEPKPVNQGEIPQEQKTQQNQQRQNKSKQIQGGGDNSNPNNNKKQNENKERRDNNNNRPKRENKESNNVDESKSENANNNNADKSNNNAKDGNKPGICRLFKLGKCFYGDNCKFRHGKVKVGLDKLCKLFLDQGKCKFDQKCHFVHMTREEWEEKYRYKQQAKETNQVENLSDDKDSVGEEEKDDFEYKSKIQLKKEKQQRLAVEHKAHKEHLQKLQNDKNHLKQKQQNTVQQPKDTKMPNVEYFDPEAFEKEFQDNNDDSNKYQMQQVKEEEEKKEAPGFDLEMIQAMNKKPVDGKIVEVINKRKFKPWTDVSKTENGKLTTELNNRVLFNNDYIGYVKSLNDNYSRDLGQIQRSYMSSFKWVQKNHMFEILHTPTCKKENLPINFDITEGYFRFRVALDPKGQGANTQYQVLNTSIPEEITDSLDELLNNIHQAQSKSIFRTLKYFDNNLEKIFKGAHDLIENQKEQEREQERKRIEEEERQKLLEQQKLEKANQNQDGSEDNENGDDDEEGDEDEEYDECEDPYFNQNDEENDSEGEQEEEKMEDPTLDLDLNMHCSLKDLQMRRIAHLRVNSLVVQVKCKSCKYDTDLTLCNYLDGTKENVLVNNLICVSCNRIAAIYCSREFVCGGDLNLAFRIGSFTWHILDIRQVSYNLTCEGCNTSKVVDNYVAGTQHNSDCHSCFQNLSFVYFSFNIEKKIDQDYLDRVKKNTKAKTVSMVSSRPKKIGTFKVGEPLPKNGACSHYRHSYRLFRFPCCGKAFACDICHDQSEKHEQILAKTMVCGFCSREQSIKQECSGCKKMLVRISSNSGYWEGGKGTRNVTAMSKSDNHKYSGQNKTISRRKIKKENMQKK